MKATTKKHLGAGTAEFIISGDMGGSLIGSYWGFSAAIIACIVGASLGFLAALSVANKGK
jgi:hypothetical protein